MSEATGLQSQLTPLLRQAAERLRECRLSADVPHEMERLAGQVDEPCVVAVVGKVKAGKSTFINALLGEDLATVGTSETTATINYFRYGRPNPERPVRCHWRGGRVTEESRAFLDARQGNDLDTLRRADGIDHLEYHLLNPYLERVVLVDTPGLGAAVDDHQARTAEFMALRGQLRERHDRETRRLGSEADAVIYLVDKVARGNDRAVLEELGQVTRGRARALNAVGVMAKIDLYPDVIERRAELAAKIARQLQDGVNTVVPVSAGLQQALAALRRDGGAGLDRLLSAVRRIPPRHLEKFLDGEEFYRSLEHDDCPVGTAEREELLGDMPWSVFTTIARLAADPGVSLAALGERLEDLAGFGPLQQVLERHFFRRGTFLRCYRIVTDARKVLSTVRFEHLPKFRDRDRAEEAQRQRFLSFLRAAGGDPAVARELEEFVSRQCAVARRAERLEAVVRDLDKRLARVFHELEEYNADFEALQQLEDHAGLFTPAELEELRALLGLHGLDPQTRLRAAGVGAAEVERRQQAARQWQLRERDPVRAAVAERAVTRYGLLLSEWADDPGRA
jgi:predicted GTPase